MNEEAIATLLVEDDSAPRLDEWRELAIVSVSDIEPTENLMAVSLPVQWKGAERLTVEETRNFRLEYPTDPKYRHSFKAQVMAYSDSLLQLQILGRAVLSKSDS
jgi:hypothetical protein